MDEGETEPEASDDAPESTSAPKKQKKRTKGDSQKADQSAAKAVIPGAGTPDGERLREALRAFDVGDYRQVRTLTGELDRASEPAVRQAAAALRARISVEPVQVMVMLACALVLGAIVYTWVL